MNDINVSPEKPPVFSVEYAAEVMLASKRKGAVVERYSYDKGEYFPHLTSFCDERLDLLRIRPGSIVGSREWFEKLPVGTRIRLPGRDPWVKRSDGQWFGSPTVVNSDAMERCNSNDWIILPAEVAPVKHSREWANSLPKGTKLWAPKQDVTDAVVAPVTGEGPWYIVGSPEWANALPDRTRLTESDRDEGWHAFKANGQWRSFAPHWKKEALLEGSPFASNATAIILYTAPTPPPLWSCVAEVPVDAWNGAIRIRETKEIGRIIGFIGANVVVMFPAAERPVLVDLNRVEWSRTHNGPWLECRVGSEKEAEL